MKELSKISVRLHNGKHSRALHTDTTVEEMDPFLKKVNNITKLSCRVLNAKWPARTLAFL